MQYEVHSNVSSVECKAREAEKMAAVLVMLVHGKWLFIPVQKIAVTPLLPSGIHSVYFAAYLLLFTSFITCHVIGVLSSCLLAVTAVVWL